MNKFLIFVAVLLISLITYHEELTSTGMGKNQKEVKSTLAGAIQSPTPQPIPSDKILENDYHIFQSFNNCGPASLSMLLSYFGIEKSQEELAVEIRPYNNPEGIDDDKSVTLDEMADKTREFGLIPYHRPVGNINLLKQFLAAGIPVLTRTWLHPDEDIGHYRVIKGYDDNSREIIQDDSFQDKNLRYSYDDFNEIWKKFNYEYLVAVPKDKQQIAERILGNNKDEKTAWKQAVRISEKQLQENPDDIYARFNLSVAYHNIGNYKASVEEFEKAENDLPYRTLWYQLEPVDSYYQLGNYDKVFEITENILSGENTAYSEAYYLRGLSYQKLDDKQQAKAEFDQAVLYNNNFAVKIPEIN